MTSSTSRAEKGVNTLDFRACRRAVMAPRLWAGHFDPLG